MQRNSIIDQLPKHLRQFIKDQPYNEYTAIDQAVWRYVMRQNVSHLSKVAHGSYINGLKVTGIDIESIPQMYGMNRILKEIGWAAVAVDGFIPPSAFMEFQAYNVLVIAADIRQLKHIEYTPAPDIIHEAAGHAPIIADQEYATYLKRFGQIGSKAISSKKDFELYEAIRHLSIIKEYPFTPKEQIEEAEQKIEFIQSNMGEPSEMAFIRRLHWWTVEYGLIGDLPNPKIYGAGLLSSIGESVSCLKPDVKKLPYDINAAQVEFDITKTQPQLFVTPSFQHLTDVLEEFADGMALRQGGTLGLQKAINSESVCTIELDNGIQVSGIFSKQSKFFKSEPWIIQTESPTALAINNEELSGHHKMKYSNGFICFIDQFKQSTSPFHSLKQSDLKQLGFEKGNEFKIETEKGLFIQAIFDNEVRDIYGKLLMLKLKNVKITQLSIPIYIGYEFSLILSSSIHSVFAGSADKDKYKEFVQIPSESTFKINYTSETQELINHYAEVRRIREQGFDAFSLKQIHHTLLEKHPNDWLLTLEILELFKLNQPKDEFNHILNDQLVEMMERFPEYRKLISDGMVLINNQNASTILV